MGPILDYDDDAARAGIALCGNVAGELRAFAADVQALAEQPWSRDAIGAAFFGGFDSDRATVVGNANALSAAAESLPALLTSAANAIVVHADR